MLAAKALVIARRFIVRILSYSLPDTTTVREWPFRSGTGHGPFMCGRLLRRTVAIPRHRGTVRDQTGFDE
jgi:hypothetical protein